MMQQVVKNLPVDTQKIADNLMSIIKKVITLRGETDKSENLQDKIKQISEKIQRLLELYLNKHISKQDFQTMKEKCDQEMDIFGKAMENCKKQATLRENDEKLLSDISSALKSLACGGQWDDTYYRHVLDKITVYDEKRIDIHLILLPAKWRFSAVSGDHCHFDASLPMSVSSALTGP